MINLYNIIHTKTKTHMAKTVKIIQRYYSKNEIARGISFHRAKAKTEGRVITLIESFDACTFFRKNGWLKNNPFKKLALPKDGDYVIIVHFCVNDTAACTAEPVARVKKKIKVPKKLLPVRLSTEQLAMIKFDLCEQNSSHSIIIWNLHYSPFNYSETNSRVTSLNCSDRVAA